MPLNILFKFALLHSPLIVCDCELTPDVFCAGSFPTAVPSLCYLHWPESLPQPAATAVLVNISMQTDAGEGKWSCDTEPCEVVAAAAIINTWLQFHICRPCLVVSKVGSRYELWYIFSLWMQQTKGQIKCFHKRPKPFNFLEYKCNDNLSVHSLILFTIFF